MCGGGGGAPTPAPAPQPAQGDIIRTQMAAMQRQRSAAANTNLVGPQGIALPKLQEKSLLGS